VEAATPLKELIDKVNSVDTCTNKKQMYKKC